MFSFLPKLWLVGHNLNQKANQRL